MAILRLFSRVLCAIALVGVLPSAVLAANITINGAVCTLTNLNIIADGNGVLVVDGCTVTASASCTTPVVVPDVTSQPQADATTLITNAGLAVGAVTRQAHPTVVAGNVISSTPAAGATVCVTQPPTQVSLLVSSGPPPPPPPTGSDTGFLSGTFIVAPNHWIVDQSGTAAAGGVTAFPGCVNQRAAVTTCTNAYTSTLNGTAYTITMALNNVLSVRYRSEAALATSYTEEIRIVSGDGAGIPAPLTVSLSTTAGDFAPVNTGCVKSGIAGSRPTIYLGSVAGQCPVLPNTNYYLNIKTTGSCSGPTCRFKVLEPTFLTN